MMLSLCPLWKAYSLERALSQGGNGSSFTVHLIEEDGGQVSDRYFYIINIFSFATVVPKFTTEV